MAQRSPAKHWRSATCCLFGLLACASVLAQAPVPCSKVAPAERDLVRKRGGCVDTPGVAPGHTIPPRVFQKVPDKDAATAQPSDRIWVPDFVGMQYAKASAALGERVRLQAKRQPSTQPQGEVIEQRPRKTYVPPDTTVTLIVSDGSLVEVPRLLGMPEQRAVAALRELRLVAVPDAVHAAGQPGTVTAQDPAANTVVTRGTRIRLTIAAAGPSPTHPAPDPPQLVWVPSYVGRQSREAQVDLVERLHLRPSVRAREASAARGEVVQQSPQETRVPAGTTVTLQVSDGTLVRVPRLVRLPVARAQQALGATDLIPEVRRVQSDAAAGTVLSQAPASGTEIKRGATVLITVAEARPPKIEPAQPPPVQPPRAPDLPPTFPSEPPGPLPKRDLPPREPKPEPPAPEPKPEVTPEPKPEVTPEPKPEAAPEPKPDLIVAIPKPDEPAAVPPAITPPPSTPAGPGPISPWWWLLSILPAAGAATWLRGKWAVKPQPPQVSAHFTGPATRPLLASHEGPPLQVKVEVSAPYPSARPAARITRENADE